MAARPSARARDALRSADVTVSSLAKGAVSVS